MSQYNFLLEFEKNKLLGLARDRMLLSRERMAGGLCLDATYYTQVEKRTPKSGRLVGSFVPRN
jgi:hypothetical protein